MIQERYYALDWKKRLRSSIELAQYRIRRSTLQRSDTYLFDKLIQELWTHKGNIFGND